MFYERGKGRLHNCNNEHGFETLAQKNVGQQFPSLSLSLCPGCWHIWGSSRHNLSLRGHCTHTHTHTHTHTRCTHKTAKTLIHTHIHTHCGLANHAATIVTAAAEPPGAAPKYDIANAARAGSPHCPSQYPVHDATAFTTICHKKGIALHMTCGGVCTGRLVKSRKRPTNSSLSISVQVAPIRFGMTNCFTLVLSLFSLSLYRTRNFL